MRSFDDLYNDIWRPQAMAFSEVIYGSEPPEPYTMDDRQRHAYLSERYRLRGELSRDNPVLTGLRASGRIGVTERENSENL